MTNQIDHIVEHLFQKKRLDDVSVYELERFIATHPYFAAGHFLLAKKNQTADPQHFKEKVAKAALYYHNPLWLQWLVDQDFGVNSKKPEVAEPLPNEDVDVRDEEFKEITASTTAHVDKIVEHPFENVENENVSHFYSPESSSEEIIEPVPVSHSETSSFTEETTGDFTEHKVTDAADGMSDVQPEVDVVSATDLKESDVEVSREPEEQHEIIEAENSENVSAFEPGSDSGQTTPSSAEGNHEPEFQEESTAASDVEKTEQSEFEDQQSRASAASIGKTLSGAALIPTKAEIEKNEFTFEPYHTIDYFASQGIKLQQSDLSKDKFGKQLKSFTEWLRSMKRLPQAPTEGNLDEATQRSIQNIAEHSFEEKDIVTETMAEVWIKQGNKEKAIETLNKLSLLNPSKSHYFAAKIEQLKAS